VAEVPATLLSDPRRPRAGGADRQRRRRRRHGAWLSVAAVVLAAATPATSAAAPAGGGPMLAPQPAGQVGGVPVGYPHTLAGAISMVAHTAEASIGLDVGRARTVGAVVAAPSYSSAGADLAAQVVTLRTSLGLPADGTTGGAYAIFLARAYQVPAATGERVTVWVLGDFDAAGPATGGVGRSTPIASGMTVAWVGGDWKAVPDRVVVPADAQLPPGTAAPAARGWLPLAIT